MITVIEDNEIELRTKDNYTINDYSIYLKGTNKCIGYIVYRKNNNGDIGYIIFPKYRGNNYAYKALNLLSQYLNENSIDSFCATCEKDNIASLKTIKKHGNIIIEKEINSEILLFECKTLEKQKENNLQNKKI